MLIFVEHSMNSNNNICMREWVDEKESVGVGVLKMRGI